MSEEDSSKESLGKMVATRHVLWEAVKRLESDAGKNLLEDLAAFLVSLEQRWPPGSESRSGLIEDFIDEIDFLHYRVTETIKVAQAYESTGEEPYLICIRCNVEIVKPVDKGKIVPCPVCGTAKWIDFFRP